MGGVTPFALPPDLPLWIDARVMDRERIVVGGGSRAAKVVGPPSMLLTDPHGRGRGRSGAPRVMDDLAARVMELVDEHAAAMLDEVAALVRVPSVSGSDAENEVQHVLAERLDRTGFDVDHWPLDLDALSAHPDFPGTEVPRREAWGLVGRLAGSGDGPTLMLNGHVDVVPTGDLDAWDVAPFAAERRDGRLLGRGTCDMKAGLVAAIAAVDAVRAAGVRLRGDVVVAAVQGEEDGGLGTFGSAATGVDRRRVRRPRADRSGRHRRQLRIADVPAARPRAGDPCRPADRGRQRDRAVLAGVAALQDLEQRRHRVVDPMMQRWPLAHPLSIGTVTAGDWASSVPDLLVAEGRLGVALDEPVDDAKRALADTITAVNDQDPWFRDHPVELEWWGGQFASGRLPADQRPRRSHDPGPPRPRPAAQRTSRPTARRTAATCDC